MTTPAPSPPAPAYGAGTSTWQWRNANGTRTVAIATIFATLIAILFFAPRFWLWVAVGVPLGDFLTVQPEFHRAAYALAQLKDPWQPIDSPVNRVIEWRLLFPVLAHWTGLPGTWYLALPHFGSVIAVLATARVAWRFTQDQIATVSSAVLVATASWFFVSTGWLGYFDSWLIVALLAATFGQSRWTLFVAALLAPWVDERFILALPLCAIARGVTLPAAAAGRRAVLLDAAALLAGIAPYLAIRIGAEIPGYRATSTSYWSTRPLLPASVPVILWGAWNGLRLGWLSLVPLVRGVQTTGIRWLIGVVASATLLINLCIADDLSRSASVAVPLLLAGVFAAWRTHAARWRRLLPLLAMGNLLLPAEHVIASADNVEAPYHRLPILNLHAERARRDDPPFFASPYVYNKRGVDAFSAGRPTQARANFDLALKFGPNHHPARANRGILRVFNGERAAGMAELDVALAQAPYLFEQRLQRAAFNQQFGEIAAALADVQAALPYIPADWPKRRDTEQFAHQLAAQLRR